MTREFPSNPNRERVELVCQESAWQDEDNMLRWIDVILVPYLQEKARGVQAIILLDAFSVHKTEKVKAQLDAIGIKMYNIPPGCTGLVQPIDVGIGKPFKDRLRTLWWDWMMEQNSDASVFTSASREEGIEWVADAWGQLGEGIARNSWRKTDFSFFLGDTQI